MKMHIKQSVKTPGLTWTLGFCAGPGEPILTDPGGAARQLMATGAFEIAGGAIIVAITVTTHVTVVGCKELAAAAHWKMNMTSTKERQRQAGSLHLFIFFVYCA